jgi:NADPH:quinone reductase
MCDMSRAVPGSRIPTSLDGRNSRSGEGRKHHCEILDQARQLVESGQLVPVLDERPFTLNNMCEAYRTIRAGAARGRLVVDIAASNA